LKEGMSLSGIKFMKQLANFILNCRVLMANFCY